MANIPFKSITFPGLPNKYTVPEISNDLMTAGKAADAKATGDALSALEDAVTEETDKLKADLDAQVDDLKSAIGADAYLGNLYHYGSISYGQALSSGANGATSASESQNTTDFIDVTNIKLLYGNTSSGGRYWFYKADKTPIDETAKTGKLSSGPELIANSGVHFVEVPSSAVYFRISFPNDAPSNLYLAGTNMYELSLEKEITDFTQNNPSLESLKITGNQLSLGRYSGALNSSTGEITENEDYITTEFIPVQEGDILYAPYGGRYWFYDSTKTKLSTGNLSNAPNLFNGVKYKFVDVEGAKFFRLSISKEYESEAYILKPTAYELYLRSLLPTVEQRKLYCLGDSITRGVYTNIGDTGGRGVTEQGYPYWIGLISGCTVVNLGVSGSGYANKGGNNDQESGEINSKTVVDDNTFSDADIVTLAFGVNDWKGAAQGVVLGDMTSESGDGTVIGNMKYCIETLVTKNPMAQLIVLLPLNTNRKWTGMRDMTLEENWAFGYAYRNNQTLQDYRTAIRQCAEYYNVKVIDLEEVCPINRLNLRNMCGDGLHPTKAFYKQIGEALANLIT